MRLIWRRDIEQVDGVRWRRRPPLGDVADVAVEALRLVVAALAAAGAVHWVTYGTLLGLVREGRLLPYDGDIDIAVMEGASTPAIKAAMAAAGLVLESEEAGERGTSKLKFGHGQVQIDIFFVRPAMPLWTDHALLGKRSLVRSTHPPVTVVRRELGDFELPVPADTEGYLTHLYGAGWRVPVTRWHWYFSPPNAELLVDWRELPWLARRWYFWRRPRRAKA